MGRVPSRRAGVVAPYGYATDNEPLKLLDSYSLNDIIRIRSTVRIFAPDFISFFDGRQPICIIQFCLTQKSTPVESKISERIC